jgi:hypothetical protein
MNYQKHYELLVDRAKNRSLSGYVERHHVLPKCIGGDDSQENLVSLTPEEHFVAHQMLVKIYPNNKKLVYAAWAMTHGKNRSNKKYGWLRRKRSEAQVGMRLSKEAREKISKARKGQKLSEEAAKALHDSRRGKNNSEDHNRKVSIALTGKPKSLEHKMKLRDARLNMEYTPELREKLAANRGKKLNEKQKAALLAAHLGKKISQEQRKKLSEAKKGISQAVVQCSHCNKTGGLSLMKRWHFDNCKDKHG